MKRKTKDHEREVSHSEVSRGSELKADEICPTDKAFDVELTYDHDDISVRDIGDDEQDSDCVWGDGPSIGF